MTNVYTITDIAADQYKGAGYALAAIKDSQVVHIRYLHDLDDLDLCDAGGNGLPPHKVASMIADNPKIKDAAIALEREGTTVFGMCSGWQFTVL